MAITNNSDDVYSHYLYALHLDQGTISIARVLKPVGLSADKYHSRACHHYAIAYRIVQETINANNSKKGEPTTTASNRIDTNLFEKVVCTSELFVIRF